MSTVSLHSSQAEKSCRRVRFSLPEASLNFPDHTSKYRTLHGTQKYINGTLINVSSSTISSTTSANLYNQYQNGEKSIMKLNEIGRQNSKTDLTVYKSSLKQNGSLPKETTQIKSAMSARPAVVPAIKEMQQVKSQQILPKPPLANLPPTTKKKLTRIKKMTEKPFKSLPTIEQKFPSMEDLNSESPDSIMSNLSRYKSTEDVRDPNNFQKNLISRHSLTNGSSKNGNIPKLPTNISDTQTVQAKIISNVMTCGEQMQREPRRLTLTKDGSSERSSSNSSLLSVPGRSFDDEVIEAPSPGQKEHQNLEQFFDFIERWRHNRNSTSQKLDSLFRNSLVSSRCSIKSDAKSSSLLSARLKAFKMSLDQVPVVTTLLRASRDANELLLKECFQQILENKHGITSKELNATDKSGRTALSYICSTNLTNFLELFLHCPGIDVNKSDNEGNTPLHFAAQAGQTEIINMLLTKNRGLSIDAKNNLGFTPLMKAALQGRTKCAKLLLFAGASPVEIDPGRGLRPDQWARFCGRHSCAEMIEQCARSRLLEKSTSNGKWPHDSIPRSKTSPVTHSSSNSIIQHQTHSGGFRSKFRKVFPFGFSLKDKQKDGKNGFMNVTSGKGGETYTNDLVNYLTAATLAATSITTTHADKQIIKSLIRPLEVPKVEVTYANNGALIKKYENLSSSFNDTDVKFSSKKSSKKAKEKVQTDAFF